LTAEQRAEQLKSGAEQIRWYHTIDLGHGIRTKGVDNTPARLHRIALPRSLEGQTVLDVGAWDGFFSFEAERRGAKRVLATDHFCWSGPGWGSKEGFEFARRALGSRVEDREIDALDLSPETVGTFDVVLFLGVLYHLKDPLGGLERMARVTERLLIVETAVDLLQIGRPAMAFYPGAELNRDPTNWWGPNLACVEQMLRTCGFREVRCMSRHSIVQRLAAGVYNQARRQASFFTSLRQGRAVFHAYK
jgi:tRNA (mo5U34)-methyltransferase